MMPHMAEQKWRVACRASMRLARQFQLGIAYENQGGRLRRNAQDTAYGRLAIRKERK